MRTFGLLALLLVVLLGLGHVAKSRRDAIVHGDCYTDTAAFWYERNIPFHAKDVYARCAYMQEKSS